MVYSATLRAVRLFLGFWIDREAGIALVGGCVWVCIGGGIFSKVEF